METTKENSYDMQSEANPKIVFVVHGRNREARNSMFRFLRSIGLSPLEWSEAVNATGKGSPYIGEVLDSAFLIAQAVIVLFTPDDEAKLREQFLNPDDENYEKELTPQARPNVIFEAGMAMGRSPDRTVLVEFGKLRPFSDIYGRHIIRLNNSSQRRQEFANRLERAGCSINIKGVDWHEEGDFDLQGETSEIEDENKPDSDESSDLATVSGRKLAQRVTSLTFIVETNNDLDVETLEQTVTKLIKRNLATKQTSFHIQKIADGLLVEIKFDPPNLFSQVEVFKGYALKEIGEKILRWSPSFT